MSSIKIEQFLKTPITFEYKKPDERFVGLIKKFDSPVAIKERPGIKLDKTYFRQNISGSLEKTWTRSRVSQLLDEALSMIYPTFGFVVFDAFRTKQTQEGLFEAYSKQISKRNPHLTEDQLYHETRKYVAHPNEPSRFEIPPHNSGGAIDIGLTENNVNIEMGTEFDDLTERAATNFFEKPFDPSVGINEQEWEKIRERRRLLFHTLVSVGFTNWSHEWWHFDLGNCVWAGEIGLPWIYDSMPVE